MRLSLYLSHPHILPSNTKKGHGVGILVIPGAVSQQMWNTEYYSQVRVELLDMLHILYFMEYSDALGFLTPISVLTRRGGTGIGGRAVVVFFNV